MQQNTPKLLCYLHSPKLTWPNLVTFTKVFSQNQQIWHCPKESYLLTVIYAKIPHSMNRKFDRNQIIGRNLFQNDVLNICGIRKSLSVSIESHPMSYIRRMIWLIWRIWRPAAVVNQMKMCELEPVANPIRISIPVDHALGIARMHCTMHLPNIDQLCCSECIRCRLNNKHQSTFDIVVENTCPTNNCNTCHSRKIEWNIGIIIWIISCNFS